MQRLLLERKGQEMTKIEFLFEDGKSVLRIDDVDHDVALVMLESKKGEITVKYEVEECLP